MARLTKKKCLSQGGTWRDGKCHFNRSATKGQSVTGTRVTKEIRYLRMRGKEPTVADVSGVGYKLTKELAKKNIMTCEDVIDKKQLTEVPGVGKTIAERILVFCKRKIAPKFDQKKYEEEQKRIGEALKHEDLYKEVPRDEEGNVIIEKETKKTPSKLTSEEAQRQRFKQDFYTQMNEERRNDKNSLFSLYNALHNLESAKIVGYEQAGSVYSREMRLREIAYGFRDAEKVGRRADAEKLLIAYNKAMNEHLNPDTLEYELVRMPISLGKIKKEREDKEKSLALAKKQLAKEKKRLKSKELDYKERETTEKMIETLDYNIDLLEKELG